MRFFNNILSWTVAILFIALTFSVRYAREQRSERIRLENNQTALLSEMKTYQVRDSLNAASIHVLTLDNKEFRKHFAELEGMVRDVGIRVRRVESVSQNAIESHYNISAPVIEKQVPTTDSDTTRQQYTPLVTAQTIQYRNKYIELDGTILDKVFFGEIVTYDTLIQIVHRIPRKFLFIKWGTKGFKQEIISSNPYSRITYSKHIKFKR